MVGRSCNKSKHICHPKKHSSLVFVCLLNIKCYSVISGSITACTSSYLVGNSQTKSTSTEHIYGMRSVQMCQSPVLPALSLTRSLLKCASCVCMMMTTLTTLRTH